jgi:RNA polymerase sigma factor (sigma-70 family)
VSHREIGFVLRSLARAGPAATDAELLGRFVAGRDQDAFAALVERYGRLVWAVCRHLAGPDADDAFQATFLVLLKNAGRVRNPNRLPAWLHGVAFRVASKARRAAARRAARERAAAIPNRTKAVLPDSAWDRALAAVHEEVARLPDLLRVPFVLCVLEGRGVTEAARQLGWKVNTLSTRLRRAKDALLARLQARGLAAGAVVALVIAADAVPAGVARATVSAAGGQSVSGTIQNLTKGVVGMSAYHWKLLAAGVLVAVGLGVGNRAGWLATADAQSPAYKPPVTVEDNLTAEEKVRRLEAQLDRAKKELADKQAAEREKAADEVARLATGHWQYAFVPVRDLDAEGFVKLLRDREAGGWDYAGQTTLKKEAVWTFRRPLRGQARMGIENRQGGNFYPELPGVNGASNPFGQPTPAPSVTTPPASVTPPRPENSKPGPSYPPKP